MPAPVIDDTHWPILVASFDNDSTLEEAQGFVDRLRAYYERGEAFVSIADLRRVTFLGSSAAIRRILAEGLNRLLLDFPGVKRGEATVMSSAASRAIFTAISMLRQQPYETKTFETVAEAMVWGRRVLEAQRGTPPQRRNQA